MSSSSSSAILSDALAVLSKTTHQIIADVEARSRSEVALAKAETNEARNQLDKAVKELHAARLEAEAFRNETIAAKAQYAQAELTIAHHLETLGQHVETIAQLRREVTQWKDTSKNWQEHFSRVEEERVALSSRIDELQAERLLLTKNALAEAQKNIAAAPSSSYIADSPTQASTSAQGQALSHTTPHHASTNGTTSRRASGVKHPRSEPPKRVKPSSSIPADSPLQVSSSRALQQGPQRVPQPHLTQEGSERRKIERRQRKEEERRKESAGQRSEQSQPQARQQPTPQSQPIIRQSTVLRRVQAVIHVKREDDSEDEPPMPQTPPPPPEEPRSRSRVQHEKEHQPAQPQTEPKPRRRRSRMIVEDDEYDEEESEDAAAVARKLRASKAIDYAESDAEEESDEDELMIGNEENREEVFTSTKPNRRTKPRTSNAGPPSKKRKVSSKPQR